MTFSACHLPLRSPAMRTVQRPFGDATAQSLLPTPAELDAAWAAAEEAAARLRRRSLASVLEAIAACAEAWTETAAGPLEEALTVLPGGTGFSRPVVQRGLSAMAEALCGDAIGELLDRELGDRARLESHQVKAPTRLTHVMAGNLPGLAFAPIALSLALRAPVLVKAAAGDPYSPAAFARALATIDEDLGEAVLVHDWRGGDGAIEDVAFAADVVVASGSDAAIAVIRRRVPGRFIGHGHKVSFAVVADGRGDDRSVAAALAFDVALWDQHGCLSPQVCFVEEANRGEAERFALAIAGELENVRLALPPRQMDAAEAAAIARFRHSAEWDPGDPRDRLWHADDTAWSVTLEHRPGLRPTCLDRCIRVVPLASADTLSDVLAPHRARLECAGLACAVERCRDWETLLQSAGVHRTCAIGTMQTPDLSWRQGGRPRIAEWVE